MDPTFIKNFFKNPKMMGAVAPSSKFLSKAMSDLTQGHIIVEIGAGTGALTKSLVEKFGYDNLYVVEIDETMIGVLSKKFPNAKIFKGSAADLEGILPPDIIGKVDTVVSGIPFRNLKENERRNIIDSCVKILTPDGTILQFTYGPLPPIPYRKWKMQGKRLKYILKNTPPAFIWQFSQLV